jgi:uncharacterized protein YjbI with pentapeptide repeats
MVVETILGGEISVSNRAIAVGPSLLYETWTWMKLEVDWAKGESRRTLLSRIQRRQFAQLCALAMFDDDILDLSYDRLLVMLGNENADSIGTLKELLASATKEEIATDVTTCTFLTWADSGLLRFAHKSFKEFFVARYLKDTLRNPVLDKRFYRELPRAVLHFLGSFGLADASFQGELRRRVDAFASNAIAHTSENAVLMRNLVGALLYSSPELRELRLQNILISNQDVFRLGFRKCHFVNVRYQGITSRTCTFDSTEVRALACGDSAFLDVGISQCTVEADLQLCRLANLLITDSSITLVAADTTLLSGRMNRYRFSGTLLRCALENTEVREVRVQNCSVERMKGKDIRLNHSVLLHCKLSDSELDGCALTNVTARGLEVNKGRVSVRCEKTSVVDATFVDSWINLEARASRFENLKTARGDFRIRLENTTSDGGLLEGTESVITNERDGKLTGITLKEGAVKFVGDLEVQRCRFQACTTLDFANAKLRDCLLDDCRFVIGGATLKNWRNTVVVGGRLEIVDSLDVHDDQITLAGTRIEYKAVKAYSFAFSGIVVDESARDPRLIRRLRADLLVLPHALVQENKAMADLVEKIRSGSIQEINAETINEIASAAEEKRAQKGSGRR